MYLRFTGGIFVAVVQGHRSTMPDKNRYLCQGAEMGHFAACEIVSCEICVNRKNRNMQILKI